MPLSAGSVSAMQPDSQLTLPNDVTTETEECTGEDQQVEETKDTKEQTKPENLWMDFEDFTKCFK